MGKINKTRLCNRMQAWIKKTIEMKIFGSIKANKKRGIWLGANGKYP